jgi:hypothetical protein
MRQKGKLEGKAPTPNGHLSETPGPGYAFDCLTRCKDAGDEDFDCSTSGVVNLDVSEVLRVKRGGISRARTTLTLITPEEVSFTPKKRMALSPASPI